MEGLIPKEMDYDDWIGDANTWLSLGKMFPIFKLPFKLVFDLSYGVLLINFCSFSFFLYYTGDKCAMHHMFSLATDFYGLGIMKDHDAFRKPMLWLRFAKACKRCGRKADAQLAVKVTH